MKKETIINEGGTNGLGIGVVNTNSEEFKVLQQTIIAQSKQQNEQQILEHKLLSIRFQMESYFHSPSPEIIEAGWFLKEFLRQLGIKNKVFAEYINFQESNLSALFKGKRKINTDLALKLGEIFQVDPTLWIHIQSKNELLKMSSQHKNYQKYNLNDLLKKAS